MPGKRWRARAGVAAATAVCLLPALLSVGPRALVPSSAAAGSTVHAAGALSGRTRVAAADRHPRGDPETSSALLRIARAFNRDYATNHDAAVYARWDAASRAVISRQAYLRRHRECPNPPEGHVDTWGVTRGAGKAWLVHYSIGGIQFTDHWYYVHGRFEFDLPKSNPSAVKLYRSSPSAYAKAVGCNH